VRLAEMAARLELKHVVVTSVTRMICPTAARRISPRLCTNCGVGCHRQRWNC